MKRTLLSLLTIITAAGCASSPPPPQAQPVPPAKNYEAAYGPIQLSEDTVAVVATGGGLSYAQSSKSKTPTRVESLSKVGDEVEVKYGEALLLVLDSLNPGQMTIESIIDESTKTVTLRVVDKSADVVVLTHKCQTIDRVGGGAIEFPRIQLAEGLTPEQVVVTPMCDDKNRMAGYSIRYGSEERGCSIQAQAGLRSFHRCGDKPKPEPKRSAKTRGPSVQNDTWRLLFYGDDRK